jgi:hypothetical protein
MRHEPLMVVTPLCAHCIGSKSTCHAYQRFWMSQMSFPACKEALKVPRRQKQLCRPCPHPRPRGRPLELRLLPLCQDKAQ